MTRLSTVLHDFLAAAHNHRIWLYLAQNEVKQRYRRSVLGPWWITLTMFIFIVAMGLVFARIFKSNVAEYIPFFTAGYLFWMLISSVINESTDTLKNNAGFIKQIKLPYSIYIFKHLAKHTILFLHNFVVYLIIIAYFKVNPGWNFFLIIPAMIILLLNLYWISLFITIISTRYRDLAPIVNNFVQIAFFITPITWLPKLLDSHSLILKLNPFAYLLNIVREPLLGMTPSLMVWLVNIGFVIVGSGVTLLLFARYYARIPFWVD